jgi:protein-tyrosine phosphatase
MTIALSRLNFRDIGGLNTADGQRTKFGVVFRSEGPASFLKEHRAELSELRVRAVCDLRSEVERQAAPNDWCDPECQLLHLDMNLDIRAQTAHLWDSLRTDPSTENAMRTLTRNYGLMPEHLRPHLAPMVGTLLDGNVPMIVHCTAGKDRTGVAIALLLSLLGVTRDQILADYAKSDVFAENMRKGGSVEESFRKGFGFLPSEAVQELLLGTHSAFVLAALDAVDRDWDSVSAYFEASGVDAKQQRRLEEVLLDS